MEDKFSKSRVPFTPQPEFPEFFGKWKTLLVLRGSFSRFSSPEFFLAHSQAAQTLNAIITAVYKTMYENASKITLNAMCRK